MYALVLRRPLTIAALLAVAGCSGASSLTSQTPAASGSGSAFVRLGVPFAPVAHHNVGSHSMRPAYSTKGSLVFEGDQSQTAVNIYQTKNLASNPSPIGTILVSTGCPYGLATDKKGTLYVADNCGGNDVEEYAKGQTTLKTAITDGISNPLGLAIDKSGTLYVSNYPAAITEYAYGTTSPSKTITGGGMSDPFGLALDKAGNLYIADFGADQVFELPAGGSSVTPLNLSDISEPLGVAVDKKNGDLWVTDGSGNKINIYAAGSTTPKQSIAGQGFPYAISFQNKGKPKGEVVYSDLGTDSVYAFKPGAYTSYATLTNGITLPTGLLITKL
jgi:DNA-binding beta-propeller fold protein YncE